MVNRTPAFLLVLSFSLLIQIVGASELINFKEIFFNGQLEESHSLENELTETRYRTEMRDTTCYRQVPYQDTECEMVPEYDTVCETIPGRQDCRTEYDEECRTETDYRRECNRTPNREQCRNVTRHRKECERGPSRRECRTVRRTRRECRTDNSRRNCRTEPAREQCRTNSSGQRRCRTIPAREICENKPEQVCRNVPYTEQECENVPGEMRCRQVPYTDRVCHTIPGEENCRNVPYSNQVCEDVPRQECEWIPSRQDCRTVQVGENQVCRDVTRYRQESYACQEEVKIPYTVTLKKFQLDSKIKFLLPEGYGPEFTLVNKLTEQGESKFLLKQSGEFKPMAFIKVSEQRAEQGDIVQIDGEYEFKILDGLKLKQSISKLTKLELTKKMLSFNLPIHKSVKDYGLYLELSKDGNKLISRDLNSGEFETKALNQKLKFEVFMSKLGLKLKNLKKYSYKLVLKPRFKKTLAFPSLKNFNFKKEGSLFTFDGEDLQRLKDHLNQLSHLELDGDKLSFHFPNHDLISDARISIKIGDLINRRLTKDEVSWEVGNQEVAVDIEMSNLNLSLSPLMEYKVEIQVEYLFSEEAPLPSDFSFIAKLDREIKPRLGERQLSKLKRDSQFLEEVELFKYSLNFKLKDNVLLDDFKMKLVISKKDKVKIDKVMTKKDLKIVQDGDFQIVTVDFKKFGGKVSKWGKHNVLLQIEHELDPEISTRRPIELMKKKILSLGAK